MIGSVGNEEGMLQLSVPWQEDTVHWASIAATKGEWHTVVAYRSGIQEWHSTVIYCNNIVAYYYTIHVQITSTRTALIIIFKLVGLKQENIWQIYPCSMTPCIIHHPCSHLKVQT